MVAVVEFLRRLIEESRSQGVTFVYAISPGLDMVFTAEKEIKALEQKLLQVKQSINTISTFKICIFGKMLYSYCQVISLYYKIL